MSQDTYAEDITDLVTRARAGDNGAWSSLIHRFRGLLAAIARSYRLTAGDADDMVQTTWLRLYESIDRLRQPESLPGWLSTTARRECLRLLRNAAHEAPAEHLATLADDSGQLPAPGDELIALEARDVLWEAVHELPDSHRRLLRTLMSSTSHSYADVSRALDMPIGSIGPTRARGITMLRRDPRIAALAG